MRFPSDVDQAQKSIDGLHWMGYASPMAAQQHTRQGANIMKSQEETFCIDLGKKYKLIRNENRVEVFEMAIDCEDGTEEGYREAWSFTSSGDADVVKQFSPTAHISA
jgi:hypothetical protein